MTCSPSVRSASKGGRSTLEVTGRRSPKGGGNPQAQLAGGPVDRKVGQHTWPQCGGLASVVIVVLVVLVVVVVVVPSLLLVVSVR